MTDDETPDGWERERLPGGIDDDRRPDYVAFRHASGDVRLRIAPPVPELDRDAHLLELTLYPGTELAETRSLRQVTSERRARELAAAFMKLFEGAYEGPGAVEDAAAFASERIQPADVPLDGLIRDGEADE